MVNDTFEEPAGASPSLISPTPKWMGGPGGVCGSEE